MTMSQDFELGFDSFDAAHHSHAAESNGIPDEYKTSSSVRNLCLIWPDGRKKFFNYAYLVSAEYAPADGLIQIAFTSATIMIKGIKLDMLYDKLLFHTPLKIVCQDERYNPVATDDYCVNEIIENRAP
ncbi:hypothetical protein CKK33_06480 [Mucilaginibacter sp. MD40]|uniref:hypothetical protein n=1 Tax=Mucilaginibacter sp. MD40 TaxID=2029590 RepID=UPI000BAC796C|nr:hypothetical protein [Mucilaginibacter sp. MD40]PAW93158.1 hypothetical protein CKK33_06480 [Mucilaginibacter sp. MD40]